MNKRDLHIIEKIFSNPLPGQQAHAEFSRNLRRTDYPVPDSVKMAAVMILLFPDKHNQLQMVFTERAITENADTHSGQMSFPGGKYDHTDRDLQFTALRETEEEIGVDRTSIKVIGQISPLYIPVSNFLAHPYVGYVDYQPEFVPEAREVAEVIYNPLQHLIDYIVPSSTDIQVRNYTFKDVPYFNIKGKVVWGATSMMLNEFLVAVRNVS